MVLSVTQYEQNISHLHYSVEFLALDLQIRHCSLRKVRSNSLSHIICRRADTDAFLGRTLQLLYLHSEVLMK